MRAGQLDRRVNLEVKTTSRDSLGQPIETWSVVRTLWAHRAEGSKVAERFGANQTYAMVTTVFRVGYFPALTTIAPDTHRLVFNGRAYNIHGVVEIGRKQGVELLCSARGE